MSHSQDFKLKNRLLKKSPFAADAGEYIGVHPDDLSQEQVDLLFVDSGLAVIRANCLDCAHTSPEVLKCVHTACPAWLYRLGKRPKILRPPRTEKQKQNAAALGASTRQKIQSNSSALSGSEIWEIFSPENQASSALENDLKCSSKTDPENPPENDAENPFKFRQ